MYRIVFYMLIPYAIMFMAGYSFSTLFRDGTLKGNIITRPKRTYIGVMDRILIIELVAIVIYVVVDFVVFWHTGAEPSALTVGFFAVCGGENGFMAWIKTRKEQERFREWQKQDDGDEYKKDSTL